DRSDFESPVVVHLDKLEAAQAWLSKNTPDVVLVDYLLDGGRDGMELIASLATGGDRAPAIMLTGARDAVVEIAAMQSGVFDYLNKGLLDVTSLERAIRFAIQRFRVERRLRESEGRLAAAAHLAEEAHAERTRVMAQLGHEFRTPLNAIIGFSDLLRDDVLT
ncbi:MAG: response regulator, partial [Alphaproteobacteria bacterium]